MLLRSWRLLLSLVAVTLLGLAVARPAAAQDEEEDPFDFDQLEGVEQVVSRTYSIDFEALMQNVTPDANFDPTALMGEGVFTVIAIVAKFDDDGHAEDGLNRLDEEFIAEADGDSEFGEVEEVDLGDLGDNRKGYQTQIEEEGMAFSAAFLMVQQDEYIYVAVGTSLGEDVVEPTQAVVEAMMDNDEGGDDIETDDEGITSGGLWDKLPQPDDEVIGDLIPAGDEQLYPVEEEQTPEA